MLSASPALPRAPRVTPLIGALCFGMLLTGCGRNAVFGLGESPSPTLDASAGTDATVSDAADDGGDPSDGGAPGTDAGGPVDLGVPPGPDATVPDVGVPPVPDAAVPDVGVPPAPDASVPDVGVPPLPDAAVPDVGVPPGPDATVPDVGVPPIPDVGVPPIPDAAVPDVGVPPGPDAAVPDVGVPPGPDASVPDSGTPPGDGGVTDAGTPGCTSNADCGGSTPTCNLVTGQCVECVVDAQCGFGRTCDTAFGGICRLTCRSNGRCRFGATCDPATGLCYECVTDADCGGNDICHPTRRECVQCASNSDCALEPGRPICSPDFECRGCVTAADCAAGEQCYPEQGGFCAPPTGRTQCTPCDGDPQCGNSGDLCIGYFVGAGFLDRSCANDCSNSACPRGFDCITVRGTRRVCRPEYDMTGPTCTAHRNRAAACRIDPNDVDPGCGVENLQDARCIANASGATVGACNFWCQNNADCPTGTTCTPVGGNVSVCQ